MEKGKKKYLKFCVFCFREHTGNGYLRQVMEQRHLQYPMPERELEFHAEALGWPKETVRNYCLHYKASQIR